MFFNCCDSILRSDSNRFIDEEEHKIISNYKLVLTITKKIWLSNAFRVYLYYFSKSLLYSWQIVTLPKQKVQKMMSSIRNMPISRKRSWRISILILMLLQIRRSSCHVMIQNGAILRDFLHKILRDYNSKKLSAPVMHQTASISKRLINRLSLRAKIQSLTKKRLSLMEKYILWPETKILMERSMSMISNGRISKVMGIFVVMKSKHSETKQILSSPIRPFHCFVNSSLE